MFFWALWEAWPEERKVRSSLPGDRLAVLFMELHSNLFPVQYPGMVRAASVPCPSETECAAVLAGRAARCELQPGVLQCRNAELGLLRYSGCDWVGVPAAVDRDGTTGRGRNCFCCPGSQLLSTACQRPYLLTRGITEPDYPVWEVFKWLIIWKTLGADRWQTRLQCCP